MTETTKEARMSGLGLTRKSAEETKTSTSNRLAHDEALLTNAHLRKLEEKKNIEVLREQRKQEVELKHQMDQEKAKRHWEHTMKKVTFVPPTDDYYSQCPLSPGIGFFKLLATAPKNCLKMLSINLPDTLLISGDLYWMYVDGSEHDPHFHVESDFRIVDFLKRFQKCKTRDCPAAILRIPEETPSDLKAMPLSYSEFSDKLIRSAFPSSAVVQMYIPCHASRAAVTRLFYPARSKPNTSSYAYIITATDSALKHSNGKFMILSDLHGGFEAYPMAGKALSEFEAVAKQLVRFLEVSYAVRVDDIVLDFVQDITGRIWLLGCKGVTVDSATEITKMIKAQQEQGLNPEQVQQMRKERQNDQLSAQHCRLCLLAYKPLEMTHVLPYKTLLLFKRHAHKTGRKVPDLSHLRVTNMDFLSQWVQLCDICYMLVLHEYELIETEESLAKALNIPIAYTDIMAKLVVEQPSFMPGKMRQWRVLIYLCAMEAVDSQVSGMNCCIDFAFLGSKCCYKLHPTWIDSESADCHTARLFYFFSSNFVEVLKLCNSSEVQFSLRRKIKSTNTICTGRCKPLSSFTVDRSELPAICQPIEILLFQNERIFVRLRAIVGLACDREVKVKEMPISISRHANVYVPEASYCNSEPLPDAWIEQMTQEYAGLERTNVLSTSKALETMYTPRLQYKEIHGLTLSSKVNPEARNSSPQSKKVLPLNLKELRNPFTWTGNVKTVTSPVVPKKTTPKALPKSQSSVSSSSKVLYQLDRPSRLRTPLFLSPRSSRLKSVKVETPSSDSIAELNELFPLPTEETEESGGDLKHLSETVSRYLGIRSISPVLPEQVQLADPRDTGCKSTRRPRHKPRPVSHKNSSSTHRSMKKMHRIRSAYDPPAIQSNR